MVDLPMPKAKDNKINTEILDSALTSVELDYLCHSKMFVPSMDQPRHGACSHSIRKIDL